MDNILSFKHSCFSGDLIYAMAGIKAICSVEGDKAVIYQHLNRDGFIYAGAKHPYGTKMMNEYAFELLKPLLEAQPYVKEFVKWQGEKVHVDLDVIRQERMAVMPYGNIVTWPAMVYAEMTPRYWEPWLEGPEPSVMNKMRFKDKIVINRSSRYHNQWIEYFFLKEHQDKLIFLGLQEEYEAFRTEYGVICHHWQPKNAKQIAVGLKSCKLFIGNQSMCFAIAEGLKVPRILEICDQAPNVIPAGEGGYYARTPDAMKYLVEKLSK